MLGSLFGRGIAPSVMFAPTSPSQVPPPSRHLPPPTPGPLPHAGISPCLPRVSLTHPGFFPSARPDPALPLSRHPSPARVSSSTFCHGTPLLPCSLPIPAPHFLYSAVTPWIPPCLVSLSRVPRCSRGGEQGHPLALGCAGQSRITWAQLHSWSPSGVVLDPGRLRAGGEWPGLARRDAQGPFPLRIAPALLRQASYGTIKIGIYQSLKRLFVDRMEGRCWGRAARAPPSSPASHSGHLPAPLPHTPGCVFCSFLALSFPPQDSHRNGAPLLGAVVFFVSESKDWIQS